MGSRRLLLITLALVAVTGAGATHGPIVPAARGAVLTDVDRDGVDDGLEQRLADTFSPVIFIEPDESNLPVNVSWFLERAHLEYHEDCFFDVDESIGFEPIISQSNLIGPPWTAGPNCGEDDIGYSHPPHRALTTTAADPDGQASEGSATTGYSDQQTFLMPDLADSQRVGSTNPREWVTYFHAYPTADGGIMLQSWHIFAYNALAVAGIGNHGGDWDASVQVQLDHNLNLEGIWFSRHSHDHPGDFFPAGSGHLHFVGTHPLMTIDGGGHAAYADPEDFCTNHPVIAGVIAPATATWPTDASNPLDPAGLHTIGCSHDDDLSGGIVWETWTGGGVVASSGLTHPITAPSPHGGLVNLGEYNPCTPELCNGSAQASTLNAGQFLPLNGSEFLRYSGRWGSLPHQEIAGKPPRGPVFQGFDDRGEGHVSLYTAWYNEGSNTEATDDGNHPWLEPPATTFGLLGRVFVDGSGSSWISGSTRVQLTAEENGVAQRFGTPEIFYRIYRTGAPPSSFGSYTTPVALAGLDGSYTIGYHAVDSLDNVELIHASRLSLDTSPPVTTITQPAATTYTHSQMLTLNYGVSDGAGSGVQSSTPTVDGATTLAGHSLQSGQTINLLTELSLGSHTFRVDATDNVGNAGSQSVTFEVIVTAASIKEDVTEFFAAGEIKNQGIENSLLAKLYVAWTLRAAKQCTASNNVYRAFQQEVAALAGRGIDSTAASIMGSDAQYLIEHCP